MLPFRERDARPGAIRSSEILCQPAQARFQKNQGEYPLVQFGGLAAGLMKAQFRGQMPQLPPHQMKLLEQGR